MYRRLVGEEVGLSMDELYGRLGMPDISMGWEGPQLGRGW